MIGELNKTAPRHLLTVQQMEKWVETKFKNLTPAIACITTPFTAPIEMLTGTVSCVYALSTAAFYKMRVYVPFVSQQRKTLWTYTNPADRSQTYVSHSLQLAIDSVKMAAMGVLKTIPGLGYLSAVSIYKLAEQQSAAEKALLAEKEAHNATKGTLKEYSPDKIETLTKELEAAHAELSGVQSALVQKNVELTQLQRSLGELQQKDDETKEALQKQIAAKVGEISQLQAKIDTTVVEMTQSQQAIEKRGAELALAQKKVEDLERMMRDDGSLATQLRQAREKQAEAEAKFKSEQDKVARYKSANKTLKEKVNALEAASVSSVAAAPEGEGSRHPRRKHKS